MKRIILLLLITSCFTCNNLSDYENHLAKGLESYKYKRNVKESLLSGIKIEKIAFIKNNSKERMLVLRLNDDVKKEDVESYTWAIHTYLEKEKYSEILNGDDYISTPIKPDLITIEGNNYIITKYDLEVDRIEQIQFFLYDRDKFRKVLSNRVTIRNIGI